MKRTAEFSPCRLYRFKLIRQWDDRPMLLVCMFNPSDANEEIDDPTVSLLCHIASFNGYGGIVVVNAIPLCGSTPAAAIDMANAWDWPDVLHKNLEIIIAEVETAGAVLIAWGAFGDRCMSWIEFVLEQIEDALPIGSGIYCLAKTKAGHPKHPMARGKHKVPKNAPLIPWSA